MCLRGSGNSDVSVRERGREKDKEDKGCCGVKAIEKVSNYPKEKKTQSDDENNPA